MHHYKFDPIKILFLLPLFICALGLSACGFSPVYATKNNSPKTGAATALHHAPSVQENLSETSIGLIPNREGQYLRNALIDRFYMNGFPDNARYHLAIQEIIEKTYNFDITADSEATRQQLKLTTQISLINNETKETLFTKSLLSIASYNILQSEFSTLITEQSARENALDDLARQIERQLTLYFHQ